MFNDEIYNNGGRPYFDFWWNGEIKNSSIYSNARENDFFFHGAMTKTIQPIRTRQFV